MTALDATVIARSVAGQREIQIGELFDMPLVSTLAPEEILTEIRVPRQTAGTVCAVGEVARRQGDFALAGVAATIAVGEDGAIARARLVSFATGPVPQRLRGAEAALTGARPERAAFAEAGRIAAQEIEPGDDLHATGDYRRAVTAVVVKRTLAQALTGAATSSAADGGVRGFSQS
jgi:CO/xanthine dehydrogenase FAD-binding subunit